MLARSRLAIEARLTSVRSGNLRYSLLGNTRGRQGLIPYTLKWGALHRYGDNGNRSNDEKDDDRAPDGIFDGSVGPRNHLENEQTYRSLHKENANFILNFHQSRPFESLGNLVFRKVVYMSTETVLDLEMVQYRTIY